MPDGQPSPEDRPDPNEYSPHLRARVPDHVAGGAFSTGAIVVTGPTEFIIDFLQTIGRPHRVAARVIIPHQVMPQFIDALAKNLGLYRDRFGDPPTPPGLVGPATALGATEVPQVLPHPNVAQASQSPTPPNDPTLGAAFGSTDVFPGSPIGSGYQAGSSAQTGQSGTAATPGQPDSGSDVDRPGEPHPPLHLPPPVRRPTPQEIYDDLKIPDSVLSGSYANGVMIGHGASEFGLDFLTSFYPQSAVSARVFMAAGQIPRLLDSLHHAMRQLQIQRQPPRPPRQSPEDPTSDPFGQQPPSE
jgi:hypothetical protein